MLVFESPTKQYCLRPFGSRKKLIHAFHTLKPPLGHLQYPGVGIPAALQIGTRGHNWDIAVGGIFHVGSAVRLFGPENPRSAGFPGLPWSGPETGNAWGTAPMNQL